MLITATTIMASDSLALLGLLGSPEGASPASPSPYCCLDALTLNLTLSLAHKLFILRSILFLLMKSHTVYLWFNTAKRIEFVNITQKIQDAVEQGGIQEGMVLVNAMHITSSVYINDAESGLIEDFQKWLKKLAPEDVKLYKHNLTGEDNAYAHLWRTIMGREVVVAITKGKLDLGPWEQIYYAEFDGIRKKRVMVKVIGE